MANFSEKLSGEPRLSPKDPDFPGPARTGANRVVLTKIDQPGQPDTFMETVLQLQDNLLVQHDGVSLAAHGHNGAGLDGLRLAISRSILSLPEALGVKIRG